MVKILRDNEDYPGSIVLQRQDGSIVEVTETQIIEKVSNPRRNICLIRDDLGTSEGLVIKFPGSKVKKFDFRDLFRVNRLIRSSPPDSPLRKLIYGEQEEKA